MKTIRPLSRETAIELTGSEVDTVSGGMRSISSGGPCGSTTTVMTSKGDVWQFDGDKCDD